MFVALSGRDYALADEGLLNVAPWTVDPAEPVLERAELAEVLKNPGAWWPDDEGALSYVAWVWLTDKGRELLPTGNAADVGRFYGA
jgi:hypothetical protein